MNNTPKTVMIAAVCVTLLIGIIAEAIKQIPAPAFPASQSTTHGRKLP